jgi:hypothetical protein
MADTPQPIFRDDNGNGKLDGEEIRKFLRMEGDVGAALRTPEHRAHAVLEVAGARTVNRDLLQNVISQNGYTDESLLNAANGLTARLLATVNRVAEGLKRIPDYRQRLTSAAQKYAQDKGMTPEQGNLRVAEMQTFADFAATFDKTFPNGIDIKPEDVPEIIKHFGPLAVPTPPNRNTNDRGNNRT